MMQIPSDRASRGQAPAARPPAAATSAGPAGPTAAVPKPAPAPKPAAAPKLAPAEAPATPAPAEAPKTPPALLFRKGGPADVREEWVTLWGLCGCGKTCCTVCTLALAMSGGVPGYVILLGDGSLEDPTLGDVPALARRLDRGEPLPATTRLNDFAFTVHRTDAPGELLLARWVDPQGEWVKRSSCSGRAPTEKELAELVECLRRSAVIVFVLHPRAQNLDQQLELLLRGLDQAAPRFERRTGFEHLSVAVVLTHWAQATGTPEEVIDAAFPGAMVRLRAAPVRLGVFGVESYGPHKADAPALMKFVLDGLYHASTQRAKRQAHEAAQERERRTRQAEEELRRRRLTLARRVLGGGAVAGALVCGGGGAVAGHDRLLVRSAEVRIASLGPDDLEGRRAAWSEVVARRWLAPARGLGWLEPGQALAEQALAELALEPSRRAFLAVLDARTAAERVGAAARFLEQHGGSPLAASAHEVARAAAGPLAEAEDGPALVDPEDLARTLERMFVPTAAAEEAAALRRAVAHLRDIATARAAANLVARLDGQEAKLVGQAAPPAPLPEEVEARALLARAPGVCEALVGRLERLEALRTVRAIAQELAALPSDADPVRLDPLARRLEVATAALAGSRFAGEAAALATTVGRVRAELFDGGQIAAALARSGKAVERAEEDVVLLARVAEAFPGHPRVGAVWTRIGELLEVVDGRVRKAAGAEARTIVLPCVGDFVAFEATARAVLARDPARAEVVRRVLDHHLRGIGFRCPQCQCDTRGAVHGSCTTRLVFREGRAVCPSHPALRIGGGGHCTRCNYAWEETR